MLAEELIHMADTLGYPCYQHINDPIWIKAFEIFNETRTHDWQKLTMHCTFCYHKVYFYHKQQTHDTYRRESIKALSSTRRGNDNETTQINESKG